VYGNAVSASKFCQHGCRNRIGFHRPPRLPNRGDVVNVNAKCQHLRSSPELGRVYSPLSYNETHALSHTTRGMKILHS
jgi:hypothetical protein